MTTFALAGVCRDINSAPVAAAIVHVFDTATNTLQATATADGSGNYTATLSIAGPLYAVAYHANSPDIAGTTLNTLMATALGATSPYSYFYLGF